MFDPTHDIAGALERIRDRIESAKAKRGPGPDVELIAVSKRHPASSIECARRCGQVAFGENYSQELARKFDALGAGRGEQSELRWHFIGGLQSNKARDVVAKAQLIHTVDRPKLVNAIDRAAEVRGGVQQILVEVNLADEPQKAGVSRSDLPALLETIGSARHLACVGLMCIPPRADELTTRARFARLRELARALQSECPANVRLDELSMGMSADFEAAILEGATMVRIGTAIFGPRPTAGA